MTLASFNLDYSRSREFCRLLEDGEILFFPRSPILLPDEDISFLLRQKQVKAGYRKNIAYKPQRNLVSGAASASPQESRQLLEVMSNSHGIGYPFSGESSCPLRFRLAPGLRQLSASAGKGVAR